MKKLRLLETALAATRVTGRDSLYTPLMYWSKKPGAYVRALIESLSEPGEVVMDPFMGSGVSVLESVRCNRKAVGIDINEWPLMITRSLGVKVNAEVLDRDFSRISEYARQRILDLYADACPNCSAQAFIVKTTFDGTVVRPIIDKGLVQFECCHCKSVFSRNMLEDDVWKMQLLGPEGVPYLGGPLVANSRTAVHEGLQVSDLFTHRAITATAILLEAIGCADLDKPDLFKFLVGGMLHLIKITDPKAQSQFLYWLPKLGLTERNVWFLFEARFKKLRRIGSYQPSSFVEANTFADMADGKGSCLLLNIPTQTVSEDMIPDESVDLVVTDPPYFDQVPYSEYMLLWSHWLGFEANLDDEIVVSNAARGKGRVEYEALMQEAFSIIARKLKVGRYLCLFYHDYDLRNWRFISDCLNSVGLEYAYVKHLPKGRLTYKNISDPVRSLKGDAVVVFVKRDNEKSQHAFSFPTPEEVRLSLRQLLLKTLRKGQRYSTAEIYDSVLLPYLLTEARLKALATEHKDLMPLISECCHYIEEEGAWTIKDELI